MSCSSCVLHDHTLQQQTDCLFHSAYRNINSTRYPIPDVPVLYLVEPTAENVKRIASDLSRDLYSPAYVNFLYSVPRPVLEDFADQIASSGTSEKIAQVYDQYLNFIVAEPNLFSLGLGKNTYWKINSNNTKDEEIDMLVDKIVTGLFSVSVTMGMCIKIGIFASYFPFPRILTRFRGHPNHTLPERRCCRTHRDETGSQAP